MKIFNNSSSGSGGGGSGGSGLGQGVGDVFFTIAQSFTPDPRVADITYSPFRGAVSDYPDLKTTQIQVDATIAGLPLTEYLNNSNLPYPYQTYDIGVYFYIVGKNIFSPNEFLVCRIAKGTGEIERNVISTTMTNPKAFFDGLSFYIYNENADYAKINEAIRFDLQTNTYETITIKSKRIAKAYYDININKYIVYEVNSEINEYNPLENGIFIYDTFDEVKEVADHPIDVFSFNLDPQKYLRLFKSNVLRKKDGTVIYVDETNFKLKNLADDSEILQLTGQDGTSTNVSNVREIYQLFDNVFIEFTDVKDSVSYFAAMCLKPDNSVLYAYAYNLEPTSRVMVFNDVYNNDFESGYPFSPALIYTTTGLVRQALTFSAIKEKQFLFENISSVSQPAGTINQPIQYSYSDDDYYNVYTKANDDYTYKIYDIYGFMEYPTNKIINLKFIGFGVPDLYIPAYKLDGFLFTKIIVKK